MTSLFKRSALAVALALSPLTITPALADTMTTMVTDEAMQQAAQDARSYLPKLTSTLFDADGTGNPSLDLKVAFPIEKGAMENEVIWVTGAMRTDTGYTAKLSNQPEHMPGLALGDEVSFTEEMIRDWGIRSADGTLYGHFTTRVLLSKMPEEASKPIMEMMQDNPVPPAWR